jgi:hypothetical protein
VKAWRIDSSSGESGSSVLGEFVAAHGDRLSRGGDGVADDGVVLAGDDEDADRCSVRAADAKSVLDEGDVEAELTGVSRVELPRLQLDHDVAELFDVEEQEVDEEVVALDVEVHVPTDESEPGTELPKSLCDPADHAVLEFALRRISVDSEEVEGVRVAGDLLREFGVAVRENAGVVARCGSLALVQARADLVCQDRSAPPVHDVLRGVPVPQLLILELVEQLDDVAPGQLSNGSLNDRALVGPGCCEASHGEEVRAREPLHGGELGAQVVGKPFENAAAPRLVPLPLENGRADLPPEQQEFGVDLALRLEPRRVHMPFHLLQSRSVVARNHCRHIAHCSRVSC